MRLRLLAAATLCLASFAIPGASAADRNSEYFTMCKLAEQTDKTCDCITDEYTNKGRGMNQKALVALELEFILGGYPEFTMEEARDTMKSSKIEMSDADLKKHIDVALGGNRCTGN